MNDKSKSMNTINNGTQYIIVLLTVLYRPKLLKNITLRIGFLKNFMQCII